MKLVPKKGFDLPSFRKSFSLNKIAIVIGYTGFANFSIVSIRLTASAVSIYLHDRLTPEPMPAANSGHQKAYTTPKKKQAGRSAWRSRVGFVQASLPHQLRSSCFRSNTDAGFSETNGSSRSACFVAHAIHALYFSCFSAGHERDFST
jgi:hypothetical protein